MLDMLVAMGLSLFILLPLVRAVSAAVLLHFRQQQLVVIEEDAHYLLDLIERAIQQAGHVDPLYVHDDDVVAVRGLDNAVIHTSSDDISLKITTGIHGSDVLSVHFSGSSQDGKTVLLNCAGFRVPPRSLDGVDRGWSIFYLVKGLDGAGDLRARQSGSCTCGLPTSSKRGVEVRALKVAAWNLQGVRSCYEGEVPFPEAW